jgi:8-oxo-dGTP diphosphatase
MSERESQRPDDEPLDAWIRQFVPHLSVTCVVFGFHVRELRLLLVKWPAGDVWTLPGAFVGRQQSLDDAARHVLRVRTGLRRGNLRQYCALGQAGRDDAFGRNLVLSRDPKAGPGVWVFQRVVSIGYYALVDSRKVQPSDERCGGCSQWYPVENHPRLGDDHERMITSALAALRAGLDVPGAGADLLPRQFTMLELQSLHEAILGRQLDRRNFQKRMTRLGGVERLSRCRRDCAHRPAYLYRFSATIQRPS